MTKKLIDVVKLPEHAHLKSDCGLCSVSLGVVELKEVPLRVV